MPAPAPEQPDDSTLDLALPSRRSTRRLGAVLGEALRIGDVVWLEGELGAGKTFLARAISRALGVPESEPVQSPTFALVHELVGRVPVTHADLYRLTDASELSELGLDERIGVDVVALVEWGARFAASLHAEGVEVLLARGADGVRRAHVRGVGARGTTLVGALRTHRARIERTSRRARVVSSK